MSEISPFQLSSSQSQTPKEDGYDWLKYGQKYCQAEDATRLYFRCKENKDKNCPAKKTIDYRGQKDTEWKRKTRYCEEHNHPPIRSQYAIKPYRMVVHSEEVQANVNSIPTVFQESSPSPKKGSFKPTELNKSLRRDVEQSIVDAWASFSKKPSKDEYSWLKYGQKKLYGGVFTRTYYRCRMHKTINCPAKKTVDTVENKSFPGERTFCHGQHNHPAKSDNHTSKLWSSSTLGRGSTSNLEQGVDFPDFSALRRSASEPFYRQAMRPQLFASEPEQDLRERQLRYLIESCQRGPILPTTNVQSNESILGQLAAVMKQNGTPPLQRPPALTPLMTPNVTLLDFLRNGLLSPSAEGPISPINSESPSSPLFANIFQDQSVPQTPIAASHSTIGSSQPAQNSSAINVLSALLDALQNRPLASTPKKQAEILKPAGSHISSIDALKRLKEISLNRVELLKKEEDCNLDLELTLGRK